MNDEWSEDAHVSEWYDWSHDFAVSHLLVACYAMWKVMVSQCGVDIRTNEMQVDLSHDIFNSVRLNVVCDCNTETTS